MRRNVARWSVLAVVAGLTLSACAQGAGNNDDGTTFDKDAKLEGTMSIMGFSGTDEIGQTRYDLAEEAISPVTIKQNEGELDLQAFLSANAAGNAPDIAYLKRDQVGDLANLGAIMPLSDCIDGEGIPTSDFNEAALSQVTFNGKVYGIPEFNQVQMTMANTDLLTAAGLTIEDVNGSSWDKIAAAATAMNKVEDGTLKTIGYDPKIPEFFPLWVKAAGGDLISEDGKTAQIDTPEALKALEFTSGILTDESGWANVKALRDAADFFGEGNQYATNELGAMNMEQWYVNVLNEVTPDIPIQIVPFISEKTGEPLAMATGSAWAISSKAKNKAAACRFIKTMVATDSWMDAAKARVDLREEAGLPFTGLLTANTVADEKIKDTYIKETGDAKWDEAIESTYTANENLFYLPANPADVAFKNAWQGAVNRVLAGEQEPAESLAQAQTEAQKALDDAWAKQTKD